MLKPINRINMAKKKVESLHSSFQSSESICNLTKPQLFGLYDDDVVKEEDQEIYEEAKKSAGKFIDDSTIEFKRTFGQMIIRIFFALIVFSISGIAYHELSKTLHDNHSLHEEFASKPLLVGVEICQKLSFGIIPTWAGYALEGILFGSLLPIVDYLTNNLNENHTNLTSVLRAINAMLGVSLGIRKIEWTSSLQASGAWFALNIVLWLFFDGTLSVLFVGIGIGILTIITCYKSITEYSQILYFIDFHFLGVLFFSKLGRFLYAN